MKKLKVKLIFTFIIVILTIVASTESFAYVSVRGYFRSDGTYVRPHVRSNPNAFKFDNYSWRPSQGLYNRSYYNPTKNYSSDWYKPSYITDPYYYLGKSLYEIGQSGLSSYTAPKTITPSYTPSYKGMISGSTSVPIVTTTSKITSPCGINEYFSTYSYTCHCKSGYKRNSVGVCEKIICGENEYLSSWTDECYCNPGYKRNYLTGKCEQVVVPPNAHFSEWSSQGWYCDIGYKQVGNTCQPE